MFHNLIPLYILPAMLANSPFLNKELIYLDKLFRMGDEYNIAQLIIERIILLYNSPEYLQQLDNTYYDIPFPNGVVPSPELIAEQSAQVHILTREIQRKYSPP